MPSPFIKKFSGAVYSKIILAFLLACLTIILARSVSKMAFQKMLGTVQLLSEPNQKLRLVNNIFRDVVRLDQLQRTQALRDKKKPYNPFLKESAQLQQMLDTLRNASLEDRQQLHRIDSLKKLLKQRDKLFISYLQLRVQLLNDNTLSGQLQNLAAEIAKNTVQTDSNVITTENKVTTTTIVPMDSMLATPEEQPEKRSLWDKLFGRKKTAAPAPLQKLIKEELKVKVDTLAMVKEDSLIAELSNAIQAIEAKRQQSRNTLLNRELAFTRAGNILINKMLVILQDIESEEIKQVEQNNAASTMLVHNSIQQINFILIAFAVGAAVLMFLIITDIARSNRYKKQLIIAKEEAEHLGQVKQRFLANMSHELRTPLQTIIGFAEQLKQQKNPKPEDVAIIYRSSRHLLQIVNEVLDYSRIVSGKFSFNNQPFHMRQILTEINETIAPLARKKGLTFDFDAAEAEGLYLNGDAFRLKQILYNLLGNAIKFTHEGTILFQVKKSEHAQSATFHFVIADTGIGIPNADMERIFNQFEQGNENNANYQSTGLGLSIVRALVSQQNGDIRVSSEPGVGSSFIVTLTFPVVAISKENLMLTAKASYTGKVWVVDDDPFILQLCSMILTKYQIAHECFDSPLKALEETNITNVQTVFLDIRMPGMNGFELRHALKEKFGATPPTFIALTAQAMPDEHAHILQEGFDSLLRKPFLEADFISMLQHGHTVSRNDGEHFDFSSLQKMIGDDPTVLQKVLSSFIHETAQDLELLETHLADTNLADTPDPLHRLAGRCSQMGFKDIARQLRQTEVNIRQGNLSGALPTLTTLTERLHNLLTAVHAQLQIVATN